MWETAPKVLGGVRPPPPRPVHPNGGRGKALPSPSHPPGGWGGGSWGQRVVVVINGDHRSLSMGVRGPPAPPRHNEREE